MFVYRYSMNLLLTSLGYTGVHYFGWRTPTSWCPPRAPHSVRAIPWPHCRCNTLPWWAMHVLHSISNCWESCAPARILLFRILHFWTRWMQRDDSAHANHSIPVWPRCGRHWLGGTGVWGRSSTDCVPMNSAPPCWFDIIWLMIVFYTRSSIWNYRTWGDSGMRTTNWSY